MKRIGIDIGSDNLKAVVIDGKNITFYQKKINGKPNYASKEILEKIAEKDGDEAEVAITGVNSFSLSNILKKINEPTAIKEGISSLDLGIKKKEKLVVIDAGASSLEYFEFERHNGKLFLENYDLEDKCGGGSGLLLDHMAKRFNYGSIEEFSNVANQTVEE